MGIFSGLFSASTEAKLARWHTELMETLPSLLDSEDTIEPVEGGIRIQHGSVALIIKFIIDGEDGEAYVMITSPLVFLPKDNLLAFYRKLLDLNSALMIGSLSTDDKVVLLRRVIPVGGLDEKGLQQSVVWMCYEADKLVDDLNSEFHARKYSWDV